MNQRDASNGTNRPASTGHQTATRAPSGDDGRGSRLLGGSLTPFAILRPPFLLVQPRSRRNAACSPRLRSIGVVRMFAPRSRGRLGLDLSWGMEVISALARLDGSVGWTAMIGSASAIMSPRLPRQTYDLMSRDKSDVIIASVSPRRRHRENAGRVARQRPLASCCHHADWMMGICVISEGGKPLSLGRRGCRPTVGPVRRPAGISLGDRRHLARLRPQGYWQSPHSPSKRIRVGGQFSTFQLEHHANRVRAIPRLAAPSVGASGGRLPGHRRGRVIGCCRPRPQRPETTSSAASYARLGEGPRRAGTN
ncbi:hypothetical protein OKW33_005902 [Paraburkholderia atlantica]